MIYYGNMAQRYSNSFKNVKVYSLNNGNDIAVGIVSAEGTIDDRLAVKPEGRNPC